MEYAEVDEQPPMPLSHRHAAAGHTAATRLAAGHTAAARPAGIPTVLHGGEAVSATYPTSVLPSDLIGGVSTLVDAASRPESTAHQQIAPNFPSHRLAAVRAAAQNRGGAEARALLGLHTDAVGTEGGWIPASSATPNVGCRPGSAKWQREMLAAEQQQAARVALAEEHRRNGRFAMKAEEMRELEHALDEQHWEAAVFQAARAVEQRQRAAVPCKPPPPTRDGYAVGFRPGSAAARRSAGGLYEDPHGGHSRRLNDAVMRRDVQREVSAQRAISARNAKQAGEQASDAAALDARERQAAVAMRGREYGDHAERVAGRKTMNLQANMALAPTQRLHKPNPTTFDRGHVAAVY